MKILRSAKRRGFHIGSAGYFTVLKPNDWFPAARPPGRLSHLSGRSEGASELSAPERAMPSSFMKLNAHDRHLMRPALIVLAAAAITLVLLWWIMSGAPPNGY
jgi:hypothetical protein